MISVVVPVYNEEANIEPLYQRLTSVLTRLGERYEVVFVDDGSQDQTGSILGGICDRDSQVVVIRLRRNFGQAAALQAGFDFAQGEVIISMDGDLQHEPEDIPQFLSEIAGGYDIVSGWRVERKDARITRQLPSRIANWMMARLSGVKLHDFGTTFKAYRRETIQNLQLYGELHRFVPALASWSGATVKEIPIRNSLRRNGRSHYGLSRTVGVLLDLISIKFLLDYSTKPLRFFGLLSLFSTGIGGVIALFLAYEKLFRHKSIMLEHGPLLFIAMLLILAGIQFLSTGLIGEMLSRTYYESQKKPIYAVREVKGRTIQSASGAALSEELTPRQRGRKAAAGLAN